MAKPVRTGASGAKKPRHTPAQKKAARMAREKQARAQLKGRRERPSGDRPERRDEPSADGARRTGGYPRRDDRQGGYPRRDDRQGSGYRGRDERGGGYRGRDDREGGYRGRDDRQGGYPRRDDRPGGGYRGRDERQGGGYRGRDDRSGGGYPRRDDRPRWADEQRDDRRDDRRERDAREDRRGPREHTWRAHREEREGRSTERGRHEGRSWDENRRRDDRGWQDRRRDAAPVQEHHGDDDREAAEAAYQEHLAASAAKQVEAEVTEDNGFAALGLDPKLVDALARTGITQPFPIQTATIPDALAGRDLLGRGQTGSGKTMAFGLPMLHRLAGRPRAVPHRPRAVIMTPTRELAMQIVDALAPLMRAIDKRFVLVAGGMSYTPQLTALDRGVDVLVATPGRLIDLIDRSAADLSEVEMIVLDEADHMAEMGFVEAIRQILDLTPTDGQRLLFSATLDHGVDQVAKTYLKDPVTHSTNDVAASVTTMEHHLFLVHPHHKRPITAAIANRPGRTIVFCRTKLGADRVALQLRESGVFAAALHGGLNQAQRTRVLDAFKGGTLPVLVATDVAARGIHVDDVSLVLQVDPPADHKDYLHRSGRTARAGDEGVVVTLALPHQKRQVGRLLDAAGVQTDPRTVAPEDTAIIETAGGRVAEGEPIPQSALDAVLRPRRPAGRGGRPAGRGGYGARGGQGGRGGYKGGSRGRDGGDRSGGRPRRDPDAPRGDGRRDWSPR
ncbi:DEAD/DEAH box helicase [Ornithinimicrobium kibberense]|uniref:DEAD/DEAH box helicase n=1 Tax=Ornithinimicrobium kibberense TaxID=282060 RepID=A0ABV5V3E1_9MICO|nr:DEAD/DEAH box helicase [Ornithinimicrobium kibberense]